MGRAAWIAVLVDIKAIEFPSVMYMKRPKERNSIVLSKFPIPGSVVVLNSSLLSLVHV